ncbi:sensor histidine kinase [Nonomuraea sp. ZG12]|uniref:sensor histidine kinase n=1 Tax=Nonomuraea sp. ZG12 TaxID=3452207 RepID=UPI003F8BF335
MTAALTLTAAAISIVLTAFSSPPAGPAQGVAALAEAAGLIVLLIVSTRLPSARLAVACCTIAGLAISVLVIRLTEVAAPLEGLGMSLFGAMLACSAAAFGVDGRRRNRKRRHHAIQARRSQRIELAKDLHDFLGHDLSAILVQAQAAIAVAEHDPAQQRIALRGIEADALRALSTLDRTVRTLFEAGEDTPLLHTATQETTIQPTLGLRDLPALLRRFNDSGTIRAELTLDTSVSEDLGPDVSATIFRVVVEALTNIRKHAPDATAVKVAVTKTRQTSAREVTVEVTSERASQQARPSATEPSGFGLIALRERVETVGGTFHAGLVGLSTWQVRAHFPEGGVTP